mmetsp:Transcript_12442/g.15749  ORF Transcript_12442/g.15749 Transcript_12442/m.15749 type:complete len:93 (-) Transcript_12442:239-517(-)
MKMQQILCVLLCIRDATSIPLFAKVFRELKKRKYPNGGTSIFTEDHFLIKELSHTVKRHVIAKEGIFIFSFGKWRRPTSTVYSILDRLAWLT